MSILPEDPLGNGGIAIFAEDLRAGRTTAKKVTSVYLERIERLEPKLQAFQYIAADQAISAAEAVDKLLLSGTDLGPLMGVPIGIKDIYAVDGMPTTNGSLYDASDITGVEGRFVAALKQAGCIVLGKTKTVEFALGATGVNEARGTPWNPWDLSTHRIPGGSSSGSGVATAAGMCAFAMGSDTGGSVRIPACLNGIFGHKTSVGLLPTDGVFPLSPTLDTLGPLTKNAADAAIIHAIMTGEDIPAPAPLSGLRLGRPNSFFFEDIDADVLSCMEAAISSLRDAGVKIVEVDIPDPNERDWIFPAIAPPEFLAAIGEKGFHQAFPKMDPVTGLRAKKGLEISGLEHAAAVIRHNQLAALADDALQGLDGWISPTCPFTAMPVADLAESQVALKSFQASRNTQPGNIFKLCAITTPIHQFGSPLPVGLQVMCPLGLDSRALSIGLALEAHFGNPVRPDLSSL
ncbi:MAG: amidase [Rhodospirillaceae bacterium]|nr:amidase [Rhodospirillaceae bacterium]|tara:strand:- start:250 stop:1632 length:1383 start_codon:yes stop_codon:yes gene_type:complete